MILPFMKLGTLALRTLAKPIASRLKQQAGVHPRFRELIINLAQVSQPLFPHCHSYFDAISMIDYGVLSLKRVKRLHHGVMENA